MTHPITESGALTPAAQMLIDVMAGRFIEHHRCGICNQPVGYERHPEIVALVFNSGCSCSGRHNYRLVDHFEWAQFVAARSTPTEDHSDG